jgi:hypothetical protein
MAKPSAAYDLLKSSATKIEKTNAAYFEMCVQRKAASKSKKAEPNNNC